jgi:hypothetical protein
LARVARQREFIAIEITVGPKVMRPPANVKVRSIRLEGEFGTISVPRRGASPARLRFILGTRPRKKDRQRWAGGPSSGEENKISNPKA